MQERKAREEKITLPDGWILDKNILISPSGYKFYNQSGGKEAFIKQSLQSYIEMDFMCGL